MAHHKLNKKREATVFCGWTVSDTTLLLCCVALVTLTVAVFLPRWRVDRFGTKPLAKAWSFQDWAGFGSREYGLIYVHGSYRQTWTTLASTACDSRTVGGIAAVVQSISAYLKGQGADEEDYGCDGSESCTNGFFASMTERCSQYGVMQRISSAVLAITIIIIMIEVTAILVGFMSKRAKYAGITTGVLIFGGLVLLVVNIMWAVSSDTAFHRLGKTAWYPYPQLCIGWFLHLYGSILLILCGVLFGICELPTVWGYDPEENRANRHKKRLNFLRTNRLRQEVCADQGPMPLQCGAPAGAEQFGIAAMPVHMGGVQYPVLQSQQVIGMTLQPQPVFMNSAPPAVFHGSGGEPSSQGLDFGATSAAEITVTVGITPMDYPSPSMPGTGQNMPGNGAAAF